MIETAESYFQRINTPTARKRLRDRHLLLKRELSNKFLRAEVNHSRWIIECPHCRNAEFLFNDRVFFCTECKNEVIKGKRYKVRMPQNPLQIEILLEPRPVFNRNWKYPETIEDLTEENKIHIRELE